MTKEERIDILVVEDEESLRIGTCDVLAFHGYQPRGVESGEEGLKLALTGGFALVLLDVMLPGISGIEVAETLRKTGHVEPIVILSAKDRTADSIAGLDAGADDYITKPFSQRLLLERIRVLLRRERLAQDLDSKDQARQAVTRGDLVLDPARHLCTWRGEHVRLTVTEFLILKALAQRPGHVKSRDQLMDAAYGEHIYVDDRTIDSHIKRLRKKFKDVDTRFSQIETLYGVGYRDKEI